MTSATETPTRRRPSRGTGGGVDIPWQVVVLNDDHNTFEGVAFALSSVLPGVSYDRGLTLANVQSSGPDTGSGRSCTGRSCRPPA
jgi:ATP-dependent Clp protease adaptor protein ClpS